LVQGERYPRDKEGFSVPRFEYKVLILGTAELLEEELNKWGQEGWRLATTYMVPCFVGHNVVATMERQLSEE
jgi:hypothetical protein